LALFASPAPSPPDVLPSLRTAQHRTPLPTLLLLLLPPLNQDLTVSTAFDVRFHDYHGVIGGSGKCDFHIIDSSASATAQLGANAGRFALVAATADANFRHVSSDCHGISGAILNVVTVILQGTVTKLLASAAESALVSALQNDLGPALANLPLDFLITNGFAEARFDAIFSTLASGA
jgi:hypothetical protein